MKYQIKFEHMYSCGWSDKQKFIMSHEIIMLKVSLADPIKERCTLKSKQSEYNLQENGYIIIPYEDQYEICFLNPEKYFAFIAFKELLPYQDYIHNFTIDTCTSNYKQNRKKETHKVKVQFLKISNNKKDLFLKIEFIKADLVRNTEVMGKMSPYLKVLNKNKNFRWESEVDKDGHKQPSFNQKVSIPFSSITDEIQIDIMDKDLFDDDLIGTMFFQPIETMGSFHSIYEKTFFYENFKIGTLKFRVLEGPKVK